MQPEDPQHPADALFDTFHKVITGEGIKQTFRDAYDRLMGNAQPQSAHDKAIQQMNNDANSHNNDAANASFLSAQQAAKIRKAAGK